MSSTNLESLLMGRATRQALAALPRDLVKRLDFELWTAVLSQPHAMLPLSEASVAGRRVARFCVVLPGAYFMLGLCSDPDALILIDFGVREPLLPHAEPNA